MKFFLSSMAISDDQAPTFEDLVGKPAKDIKLALIENAADMHPDPNADWIIGNRQAIMSHGYQVERLDLRDYKGREQDLTDKLASQDAIWVGGGNTYYLRWVLQDTGADGVIKDLVQKGLVYGGGSAGAIVAGPTLHYFETADDPADAPETIYDGLALINEVVVPHIDDIDYGPVLGKINDQLKSAGYSTILLTDAQAVAINNSQQKIVPLTK